MTVSICMIKNISNNNDPIKYFDAFSRTVTFTTLSITKGQVRPI